MKKIAAVLLTFMILLTGMDLSVVKADAFTITKAGAWFETAYLEWEGGDYPSYNVYYKEINKDDSNSYVMLDSSLVRGNRADIPGLKSNTAYSVRVECGGKIAVANIRTYEYDRSGYAHFNYSEGIGAYYDNGALKPEATILYVNNENKDTIQYNGQTGIYKILASGPKNLNIRIIGSIDVPAGCWAHNGKSNDGWNMVNITNAENVTIEGIGYDANLVRWGFSVSHSKSIEIRNLSFARQPDDAIGIAGSNDNKCSRIWIHNNSFAAGLNEYAGNGIVDDDKASGDGSTDVKRSEYVTISYNYYDDCAKTSLVGGGTNDMQDYITYHHNWFNGTDQRTPRARNAHIHMYNNYFSNVTGYCVGASHNSMIFTEANYFENSKSPLYADSIGSDPYSGCIKSYEDYFTGCTGTNNGTKVSSREEIATIKNQVAKGKDYDNFDLDPVRFYVDDYAADTAEEAKRICIALAGRMLNVDYVKIMGDLNYEPGGGESGSDPSVPIVRATPTPSPKPDLPATTPTATPTPTVTPGGQGETNATPTPGGSAVPTSAPAETTKAPTETPFPTATPVPGDDVPAGSDNVKTDEQKSGIAFIVVGGALLIVAGVMIFSLTHGRKKSKVKETNDISDT